MPAESKPRRHVLLVTVNNEAGVLARIVSLFSGRGWNIEGLTVAKVRSSKFSNKNGGVSRITIVTFTTNEQNALIITQIEKIVPVRKVQDLTDNINKIEANVTLVRVATRNGALLDQIVSMTGTFGGKVVLKKKISATLRFASEQEGPTAFLDLLKGLKVKVETVYSGNIAMA